MERPSYKLPIFENFIKSKKLYEGVEDIEALNQKIADLIDDRREINDKISEADDEGDKVKVDTLGIDAQIIDLKIQIARLKIEKDEILTQGL